MLRATLTYMDVHGEQKPTAHPDTESLTEAEVGFLDRHSGTTPNPDALRAARAETKRLLATTTTPDVPHVFAVRDALPISSVLYEAVEVAAFVNNARIDDPDTDDTVSVREWLRSGRDPQPVIALADSLHWGL